MALKIRLRKQGSNNRDFYRLVVTDSRSPRDGKYLEVVGWYNPIAPTEDLLLNIKPDRIQHWLDLGAQLSEKAATLVAKSAPAIIRGQTEKRLQNRAKAATKRKEQRKKAAA